MHRRPRLFCAADSRLCAADSRPVQRIPGLSRRVSFDGALCCRILPAGLYAVGCFRRVPLLSDSSGFLRMVRAGDPACVKNSGKHPKKDASRSIVGVSRVVGRMGGGADGAFCCPARRKFRPHRPGLSFAAHPSRLVSSWLPLPYFLPFTFHFLSPSANPCEMKVRIGSRPVRQ